MAKRKKEELFEDLGFEGQDEASHESGFDDISAFDETDGEDPVELERRRTEYSRLRKNDKIFNNSYNMGQNLSEEDESESRSHTEIKLDPSSPDYHLYDREKYSDHIDNKITQYDIDQFVSGSSETLAILGDQPDKRKFTKPEVNELFQLITVGVSAGKDTSVFVSPIHILDAISSLTCMEYKKLFDMLTYEHKEILLLELNKKYGFLDKPSKNLKMF